MSDKNRVCLMILDGWGHGPNDSTNAIYLAHTPFTDGLYVHYPNAELRTDGEHVGLPEGQMGNSEVGHMNIGAGRVVYQDLVRINIEIREGGFFRNPVLSAAMAKATTENRPIHFIGLVSNGGVHSHIDHLKALCTMAKDHGVERAFVHAFLDGRDTDPRSGAGYMRDLEQHIADGPVRVASLVGRYYAMDRDKRWERVRKAYDLLVHGTGESFRSAGDAIAASYDRSITDEFLEPSVVVDEHGSPIATIQEGDIVICFNFRTDRCREITQALTQQAFHEQNMHPLSLHYITMTNYDETFRGVQVVYDKDNLQQTLGEVIAGAGLTQVRIAETEKYPHVTFFFSGGREEVFPGESRLMVNSPKVATYDLQPAMSAPEIADAICDAMMKDAPDFICLNFANADMVGHTGVFPAIVEAVETVDRCAQKVVQTGLTLGYSFIIIADHGNADCAINPDGSPNTAHTTNPVPIWVLDSRILSVRSGILADVAPTVLRLLGIPQPEAMTGTPLC